MEDRELLELAAKAAGIKAILDPVGKWRNCTGAHPSMNVFSFPLWNPLTDDGDALRLAVKLRLVLLLELPRIGIGPRMDGPELYVEEGEDEFAAARRAIVRAAAGIGKNMP